MPLFRPEALRGQDTLHGEVSLVPPVSWQLLSVFMLASVVAAGAFMASAGYAKVTVARGTVTGDKGVVRIAPSRAGVFDRVLVAEGQAVEAGAPLARVSLATEDATGALQARRAEALARQEGVLASRLGEVALGGRERIASLEARMAGDRSQIAGLNEQIVQQRALIAAAQDDLEKIQPIVRQGLISNHDLRLREEAVATRKQTLSRLQQDVAERQTSMRMAQADIARAQAETATAQSEVTGARAELDRSAAGEDVLSGLLLRAPVAGVVTAIAVHAGDPATPGSAVMTLVPRGTRVEAQLAAPAASAGLLEVGQSVRIAVDAFPYQTYGALQGRVTSISRTTAPVGDAGKDGGEAFLVRATLPPTVTAYGAARPLRPGMTLTARIKTRPRSLLAWVFDPVLAVQRR